MLLLECLFSPWVMSRSSSLIMRLRWRSYSTTKVLSTTWWVELVEKKEFTVAALDAGNKIFVVRIVTFTSSSSDIYPFCRTQIAFLKADKAATVVPSEYADFADIISLHQVVKLSEHIEINDHAINFIDNKQLFHKPIYSPDSVELETLKTYLKINLANSFIRPSKFFTNVLILFVRERDGRLRLCKDYREDRKSVV